MLGELKVTRQGLRHYIIYKDICIVCIWLFFRYIYSITILIWYILYAMVQMAFPYIYMVDITIPYTYGIKYICGIHV